MYIYRNSAVEYLFKNTKMNYSNYNELSIIDTDMDILILYMLPYCYSQDELLKTIDDYKKRIEYITTNYKEKNIYALTLVNYYYSNLVISNDLLNNAINEYNHYLYSNKNIKVIDLLQFYNKYDNVFDLKYYYLYDAIISPKLSKQFEDFILNEISSIKSTRKKCLVLDLDNTLWGGIIGEDGTASLKISGSYPGNCFNDFQKMILELKKNGIILCICSKNNYDDVLDCFKKRNDLVLSLEDFTILKINWNSKRDEIINISKELNIDLDSIVFIDDNPREREIVRSLNDVVVLDFPKEVYLMCDYFYEEFKRYFSVYSLTEEDKNKSTQYMNKIKSDKLRKEYENEEDFIKQLNIEIVCEEMNDYNVDRIEQLINKSNQFNLTTKRYAEKDLLNMKNSIIYSISVKDKFGNLGITGISIVNINNNTAHIDSFLLSCRVLGRKIENEFLKIILNEMYKRNILVITSEYIPTKKNMQVCNFYSDNGFEILKKNNDQTLYQYKINNIIEYSKNYKVEVRNGK